MKKPTLMRSLVIAAAALMAVGAHAQSWPSRTITFVVPFPAGGTTDAVARVVAQEASKALGQQIIVENKPGANGNVGSAGVVRAQPDGYTFLVTGVGSNAINHSLYAKMPFDSAKDLSHVALLVVGPNVLISHADVPAKNLKELIALAKAKPGKYDYASAGVGASGHLAMELLKQQAGISATHVPYRGGGPALNDVVAGQVPMMFLNQDVVHPHIQSGRVRALGVASLERNPLYPDVPTIAEQGFPGFSAVSWVGLSAPRGLPKEILSRMHDEVMKALQSETVKEKLVANGFVVGNMTAEAYGQFVTDEIAKWAPVVKAAGAKLD